MNIIETLGRVFPGATLGYVAGGTLRAFEVQQLPRDFVPQQCEILARAREPHPRAGMRREYFLVQTEDALLYFRISTAVRDAGRECAIGQGYTDRQDVDRVVKLTSHARQIIGNLTRAAAAGADETRPLAST